MLTDNLAKKVLVAALVLSVSACATKKTSSEDEAVQVGEDIVATRASEAGDVMSSEGVGGDLDVSDSMSRIASIDPAEIKELLNTKVFYFAYDQFSVGNMNVRAIKAHGLYLSKNPLARVRLEGHADERGTREYNIALGERRGKSVKQLLLSKGARSSQIEVISFGEEQPKVNGHDENAYGKNRRAEIEYTKGQP